nr:hypothetical protein [uncultured Cetobacterium sp.]
MTADTIDKIGIWGAVALFFAKLVHTKETQQCNQNDLLVHNLIESNKNLSLEFKSITESLNELIRTNHKILEMNQQILEMNQQILKKLEGQNIKRKKTRR